jgi:hypothetical protein
MCRLWNVPSKTCPQDTKVQGSALGDRHSQDQRICICRSIPVDLVTIHFNLGLPQRLITDIEQMALVTQKILQVGSRGAGNGLHPYHDAQIPSQISRQGDYLHSQHGMDQNDEVAGQVAWDERWYVHVGWHTRRTVVQFMRVHIQSSPILSQNHPG